MTQEGSSAIHRVNAPPADVGAEEGDIAASRHKIFHTVAHWLAPVFVVPHTEQKTIAIAKFGICMNIKICAELRFVSVTEQPADETRIPVSEALPGGAHVIVVEGAPDFPPCAASRAMQRQL